MAQAFPTLDFGNIYDPHKFTEQSRESLQSALCQFSISYCVFIHYPTQNVPL